MSLKLDRRAFSTLAVTVAAASLLPGGPSFAANFNRIFHSGDADGVIFAIKPNGDLHWYRYTGTGVNDVSGATGWAQNSGNRIGNGWHTMREVIGYGGGVILAIAQDGNLLWYRYDGDGTDDVSGATGWHPASSSPIGNGWQGLRRVFATPAGGGSRGSIFGVKPNGDLVWYSYIGGGEADVSGATGWAANSGNPVGRGWGDMRALVGSAGGQIFAVEGNGNLRWYEYVGDGTADVTGATGWAANSSNTIGRGWSFHSLFSGPNADNAFPAALYGVGDDGNLRWYAYDGRGVNDQTGATGWHQNSSNFIGNGW